MPKSQLRRCTVYLPSEVVTWLDVEKERKQRTRSRTIVAAVEIYRVLSGFSDIAQLAAYSEEVLNPARKNLTKLLRRVRREKWEGEYPEVPAPVGAHSGRCTDEQGLSDVILGVRPRCAAPTARRSMR